MIFKEKKESKKTSKIPLASFTFLIGILGGTSFVEYTHTNTKNVQQLELRQKKMPILDATTELIKQEYAEPISYSDLEIKAIKGLINELDPHSAYLDKYAKSEFNRKFNANTGMIGITLGIKNKKITVVGLTPNSPAQQKGILKGDIIKKIF